MEGSPGDRIRQVVSRCDVCIVDLDQCVYPRFTQTALGRLLLYRSLFPGNRDLFPQLLAGAFFITRIRTGQIFGRHPSNYMLMAAFDRVIRGMPMELVEECSSRLPMTGPQDWRIALRAISTMMDVHLLTFSIDPVAGAYGGTRDFTGRTIFRGWRGTPLTVNGGIIDKVIFSPRSLSPEAKLEAMEEIMTAGGFQRPLIIGHGQDESPMAGRARGLGGGSLGFSKAGGTVEEFDLILPGDAWKTIASGLTRFIHKSG
ncbi:MAG: hypothetical protein V1789_05680 [PVC group bacterium]